MPDMDTATLEAHIAVIKRATEAGRESCEGDWHGKDFAQEQSAYDPSEVDHAIAAILNAVADGALVPASTITAQAAQIKLLREALTFYADTSDYVAPLTGGAGRLYFDCGQVARAALQSEVSHG